MQLTKEEMLAVNQAGIDALILFGSHAQGVASKTSDFDFFVIGGKKQNTYDLLYNLLSDKIKQLVDIDIVFEDHAPLELKQHVAKYGQVVYQKQPTLFSNFKEKTMIAYADFAPLRAIFSGATISRIDSI